MSKGNFDLFDADTARKAFNGGGSLRDVLERAAEEQARKDAYVTFHGGRIVAAQIFVVVGILAVYTTYAVAVIGLALALFGVIGWQTEGALAGTALVGFLFLKIVINPVGTHFVPYVKRRIELRRAARANATA